MSATKKPAPIEPVDITTLPDADLSAGIIDLASRRLAVKEHIEWLDKGPDNPESLDNLSSQLLSLLMVNHLAAVKGNTDLEVPFTARVSSKTTRSLSVTRLMERGVTTDDIEYATEEKVGAKFVEVRVGKEKKEDGQQ